MAGSSPTLSISPRLEFGDPPPTSVNLHSITKGAEPECNGINLSGTRYAHKTGGSAASHVRTRPTPAVGRLGGLSYGRPIEESGACGLNPQHGRTCGRGLALRRGTRGAPVRKRGPAWPWSMSASIAFRGKKTVNFAWEKYHGCKGAEPIDRRDRLGRGTRRLHAPINLPDCIVRY